MATGLPDWVFKLREIADEQIVDTLAEFGEDPEGFIKRILVDFVLMGIATFTLDIIGLIDQGFQAVIDPFTDVRFSLVTAVEQAGGAVVGGTSGITSAIATGIADQLGIAAFPVLVAMYALEFALLVRAIPPAFAALSDALGSIPIAGSLLDSVVTFLQKYIQGGDS
jgi:hypothetical protein